MQSVRGRVESSPRPPGLHARGSAARAGSIHNANTRISINRLRCAHTQVWNCHEINGEFYLRADYSLRCYDRRWYAVAGVASAFAVVYVAGLPLVMKRKGKGGKSATK